MKHDLKKFFLILSVLCLTSVCMQSIANNSKFTKEPDNNEEKEISRAQALKFALDALTPSTSANDWIEQNEGEFKTPLADTGTPWGESMFDETVAKGEEIEHLGDIRRDNRNQVIGIFVVVGVIMLCLGVFMGLIIDKRKG